jgi:hypothetical protein
MKAPDESICSTAAGIPSVKSWRAIDGWGAQPHLPFSEILRRPESIGDNDVGDIGEHCRVQGRAAISSSTKDRATHEGEEEGDGRGGNNLHVGRGRVRDIGRGAEEGHDRRGSQEQNDGNRDGKQQSPDDGLPRKKIRAALIASADGLGDQNCRADIDG